MIYLKGIRLNERMPLDKDEYPLNIPALRNFSDLSFDTPVTFIVGENGMGKSTLIEAIAISMGFNAEGGSRNFNFTTHETHSRLYEFLITAKSGNRNKDGYFLRAESFYNVITEIDRLMIKDYYGGKSLHNMSHGEGFLKLLMERCHGRGFYIFDEPEAALSPFSQIKMLVRMHQLVDEDSQFIISTHSPILMSYPGAKIYQLTEDGVSETTYEQTEHFLLMKYFVNNTNEYLRNIGVID